MVEDHNNRDDVMDLDEQSVVDEKPTEESANIADIPWNECLEGPNANDWKEAILIEMECLVKNDTWSIVNRPKDRGVIGCRTILRNKYKPDGTIDKRKARVVARGFSQHSGINFHETFVPVARLSSVRLLMALAVQYDFKVRQLDITTAYLNGKVEEELYMEKPELLIEFLQEIISRRSERDSVRKKAKKMIHELQNGDDMVCKLNKALYGLKQVSR